MLINSAPAFQARAFALRCAFCKYVLTREDGMRPYLRVLPVQAHKGLPFMLMMGTSMDLCVIVLPLPWITEPNYNSS
eukprot:1159380-Pelagomonas_calceolata.AAC.3